MMIKFNQEDVLRTLKDVVQKLEESLIRMEKYQRGADSPGEEGRWSSEATHRLAEKLLCEDLIARLRAN